MQNQNNQLDFLDIITLISFYIAIQNLQENEQQSKILEEKLDYQDEYYLKRAIELLEESIKQNQLIIQQNEELLKKNVRKLQFYVKKSH
jgi:hypothetical protein